MDENVRQNHQVPPKDNQQRSGTQEYKDSGDGKIRQGPAYQNHIPNGIYPSNHQEENHRYVPHLTPSYHQHQGYNQLETPYTNVPLFPQQAPYINQNHMKSNQEEGVFPQAGYGNTVQYPGAEKVPAGNKHVRYSSDFLFQRYSQPHQNQ